MTSAGPDLVIAGAARSGTSTLAAALREHPAIDPGASKEPNYFSRYYERGTPWYDALFAPRAEGLFRMDASTSYTYPQYPGALDRLAVDAPAVQVVYSVRDPIARSVSHYLLRRFTLQIEDAPSFGAALAADSYYSDVSDYRRWITHLQERFGPDRFLLVPFAVLTSATAEVAEVICGRLGIPAPPLAVEVVGAHRNAVVEFRGGVARRAARVLRRSPVYPRLRSALGATRIRHLRSRLTKPAALPSLAEALASCSPEQLGQLTAMRSELDAWVGERVAEQDVRAGLQWAGRWPEPRADAG